MSSFDEAKRFAEQEARERAMIRRNDHATSVAAAKRVMIAERVSPSHRSKGLTKMQRCVYDTLAKHETGLADSELRELCTKVFGPKAECTWRKRRGELVDLGYVAETGERRKNAGGQPEKVWAVVAPLE